MKKLIIYSSELLSLVAIAFVIGNFLDKKFSSGGWLIIVCLFFAYAFWFLSFYKRQLVKKRNKSPGKNLWI